MYNHFNCHQIHDPPLGDLITLYLNDHKYLPNLKMSFIAQFKINICIHMIKYLTNIQMGHFGD